MFSKCYYLPFSHPTASSKLPKSPTPSKLPKCRYLRVPLPSCGLEVTKVSPFIVCLCDPQPRSYQSVATFVFPSCLAPSMFKSITVYRFFTRLRPRSYQSVVRHRSYQSGVTFMFPSHPAHSKLPKYHYSSFFFASRSREVTKVSLPSCSPPILRPRSCQSTSIHCFFRRPAASKFPKSRYFRVPIPLFFQFLYYELQFLEHIKK